MNIEEFSIFKEINKFKVQILVNPHSKVISSNMMNTVRKIFFEINTHGLQNKKRVIKEIDELLLWIEDLKFVMISDIIK
jgi:hypothetical protein